ncbi:hypothetical protein JKF63_01452 [Porcisia hertigi]|uniref:Uncharacterized protein n=1 Tax=Porcisia hertigi TaxID=2761500 RepID=A0A836HUR8_9TRYP|nr:hypothetical protein JKF63_01452 [Porcisia hertigi]
MTTVKDLANSAVAAEIASAQKVLPSTCGEETGLSGVPRVGCVAAITYQPQSLHGFSACVVGLADGIAIIGPDLIQRRYGHHRLLTRQLWRPVTPLKGGGKGPKAPTHESRPAAPSSNGTTMPSPTKGSSAHIVAVTACLVAGADVNATDLAQSTAEDDTIAIVVAWSDATLQHHVAVLMARLRCVLTPSPAARDCHSNDQVEAGLVQVVAHDALPLCPTQSVLRLFYHPAMATCQNKTTPHHVVMCSVYSPWGSTTPSPGHLGQSDSGTSTTNAPVSAIVKKPHPAVGSGAAAAERDGASAAAAALATTTAWRRGELLYLTVSACCDDAADNESVTTASANLGSTSPNCRLRVRAGPSESADVAPWLTQFQPGRVICAFAVQSATTSVIAAAGTIDGRVYLLGLTSWRLVRRVSGPVADAIFVRTKPARTQSRPRNAVVDSLLDDAAEGDAHKNGSFFIQTDEEFARHDESSFSALVILDSAGHLLVQRAVNSGASITQSVADIPQVVTLATEQPQKLTFVNTSMASLEEATHISPKSFLDLSSLRHFFGRRRPPPLSQQHRNLSRSDPCPANPPLASSSLATSPVNQSFSIGNTSVEDTNIAGHILSRGLLCVTCIDNPKSGAELIVSTMGQAVVSVPFSPTDGCFRIAGFTVTPAPMFYVGFVDFFADGNPTLVMAGLKNVLVARRPHLTIRDRAQLLMRLLTKKERELQNAESDVENR